jgi:hypothetical protein
MKSPTEKSEEVKKDNPEQSRRFVETAKAVECEESELIFNKAIDAVAKSSTNNPSGNWR